ncbi:glycosyltransferase [Pseudomonas sp. LRF_L74]|uniref:glycosyltransferase n=1 Tax=Pseudomonas sp. LRF_L74 TaxID=3369422 RepID=UPI003F5DFFDC
MNSYVTPTGQAGSLNDSGHYQLSIILPRLHEPRNIIKNTLRRISNISETISIEIIIVNDGGNSSDLTGFEDRYPQLRIIHNRRCQGKGYSIRRGVSKAKGRYIFYSDIDLPIGLTDLVDSLHGELTTTPPPMIIGQRTRSPASDTVTSNPARRMTSTWFRKIFQLIIQSNIADSQCPFKLIERSFALRLFGLSSVNGYAFDAELIFLAHQLGIELVQKKITWTDTRAPWTVTKSLKTFLHMTGELLLIRVRGMLVSSRLRGEREEIEQELGSYESTQPIYSTSPHQWAGTPNRGCTLEE